MMLMLASWGRSLLLVEKAESKLFMINELSANLYYLAFSLIGYKTMGLIGLGIAFALEYIVYFIQCYLIARKRYNFSFSNSFIKSYGIQLLLIIACLIIVLTLSGWHKFIIGSLIISISCYLGLKGLNEKMELLSFVRQKIKK